MKKQRRVVVVGQVLVRDRARASAAVGRSREARAASIAAATKPTAHVQATARRRGVARGASEPVALLDIEVRTRFAAHS